MSGSRGRGRRAAGRFSYTELIRELRAGAQGRKKGPGSSRDSTAPRQGRQAKRPYLSIAAD